MADYEEWWLQLGTGSGHGWTDKEPAKRPAGFAPPKPEIVIAETYRPKTHKQPRRGKKR